MRGSSLHERRAGHRALRPAAAVALALASFAVGAITARPSSTVREPAATPPAADRAARHRAPATSEKRTRRGAAAAATAFLGALDWKVLVDDERRAATVDRFAASGAGKTLESVVSRGVDDVRQAVRAAPVVVRPVPIGYRVDRFSRKRAVVSVWGMALFGTASYEPVSQWATTTVDLVWQGGEWKVAAMRNRGGPSPRWSIEELARDAASFDEYRHVP
jgi:hypothetical protein